MSVNKRRTRSTKKVYKSKKVKRVQKSRKVIKRNVNKRRNTRRRKLKKRSTRRRRAGQRTESDSLGDIEPADVMARYAERVRPERSDSLGDIEPADVMARYAERVPPTYSNSLDDGVVIPDSAELPAYVAPPPNYQYSQKINEMEERKRKENIEKARAYVMQKAGPVKSQTFGNRVRNFFKRS